MPSSVPNDAIGWYLLVGLVVVAALPRFYWAMLMQLWHAEDPYEETPRWLVKSLVSALVVLLWPVVVFRGRW